MPEKDPPVYLDYDQVALDAAYDQAAYAPNREQLIKRRIRDSELTRLRIGEILVDAKGVSRLYHPRPGLTPLLVVIAAGLIAMIAVVWMTPALRDVVDLLWLKLELLFGAG